MNHKKTPASLSRAVNEVCGYSDARVPFRPRQLFQHPSACHPTPLSNLDLALPSYPQVLQFNNAVGVMPR